MLGMTLSTSFFLNVELILKEERNIFETLNCYIVPIVIWEEENFFAR